jgi:nucleotide-binding universal stress UspA family protein
MQQVGNREMFGLRSDFVSGFQPRKVVVPVDFSEDSLQAMRTALDIAGESSHVYLVHVLMQLYTASPGVLWDQMSDQHREEAVRAQFEKLLAEHQISGVHTDVRLGDPGLGIADYAEEIGADLIVIPTHGYHGVKRFVLGSVADRVIRHAPCSVLVLRRADAE